MNNSHPKTTKRPFGGERPFPWKCHHCFKSQVVMTKTSYDAEVRHDGRVYTFTIPDLDIPACQACGEKVFTENVDDQISAGLRSHLHLLTPEEIRAGLERLDLKQKEAAERLGIAEATLSRWLTDTQIQSRALDNLVRVFFAFPQVREALSGDSRVNELGILPNDPGRAHLNALKASLNSTAASEVASQELEQPLSKAMVQQMMDEQISPLREQVRRLENELHSVGGGGR